MVNNFDDVRKPRRISASDFRKQQGQDFPIDTILYKGPEAINIVLLGDGYTASEQTKFRSAASSLYSSLFKKVPINKYRNWCNLYSISVISEESGISHPGVLRNGTYVCPEGSSLPIKNVKTYFGLHFDAYNIHRLPCPDSSTKIYNLLNALMPNYDLVGIIANSSEYGGSGGAYLTCTTNSNSAEIFIHEFGHTFAGLADEYFAGDGYLREYPNLTANSNRETIKWKHWLGLGGVGVYTMGGSTKGNSYYKPVNGTCEMEYLNKTFCPVCRETIIEEFHKRVKVIADYEPIEKDVIVNQEECKFAVTRYFVGTANKVNFRWELDGDSVQEGTSPELILNYTQLQTVVPHTVKVSAHEINSYVKNTSHASKHTSSVTWKVQLGTIDMIAFTRGDTSIEAVSGGLQVTANHPYYLSVYNLMGHRLLGLRIIGRKFVPLRKGTYIVEGKKIYIR